MPSPHPQGRIVELASFPSRFEADVVIAMLATNGIRAIADYGDSDGWAPHLALYQGARVLVLDDDLQSARALLDSTAPLDEPTDN
ncbi:MAG TPA: DUF2007 domain-containing protein [Acidimicrobiia bacterium]|nr:DUF2007 domain-containing protein [Acidimicrobiia bacterium]